LDITSYFGESMVNSRQKGARGEREAAKEVAGVLGVTARRGQQFSGGDESPDIKTSLEGVHFEVKRVESLNLYKALAQATEDAGDSIPVVLHKRNHQDWVAIVRLSDLPALSKKVGGLHG
jgi:hypothetical protein